MTIQSIHYNVFEDIERRRKDEILFVKMFFDQINIYHKEKERENEVFVLLVKMFVKRSYWILHAFSLQVLTCVKSPVQFIPANDKSSLTVSGSGIDGEGSVQVRERVMSPLPHDFEHCDHSDHGENPPSTE